MSCRHQQANAVNGWTHSVRVGGKPSHVWGHLPRPSEVLLLWSGRWQWASDVPGSKHRQQSQAQAVPTASAGKACSLHTLTPSLALGRPGTQIHSRAALLRTDYGETQDISPCPQPAACRPLPPTPVLSPPLPRGCSPGKLNPQWPNTAATFDQSLHVPHYIWAEGERNLIDIAELGGYGC